MIDTGKTVSPRPLTALEHRAVIAMQAHLRCEDLLSGKANAGRMDRRTVDGLQKSTSACRCSPTAGTIDLDTRTALLGDSREHDFRALLRALRERVVDATGLSRTARRRASQARCRAASSTPPSSGRCPSSRLARRPRRPRRRRRPRRSAPAARRRRRSEGRRFEAGAEDHPGAGSDRRGHAGGERRARLDVAGRRPREHARRSTPTRRRAPRARACCRCRWPSPSACRRCRRTMAPRWSCAPRSIAARSSSARPKLDKDGHKKWKPPVADRPTLTLYAKAGDGEIALVRWPTTIGGWKTFEKIGRHAGAQVQGVGHGRGPLARGPRRPDLAPGGGRADAPPARQGRRHVRGEDGPHRPRLSRGLRARRDRAPPDRGRRRERSSRSSSTTASARTARPCTVRSGAARAAAATACTTTRRCGSRVSSSGTTRTRATASCPRTTSASSSTRASRSPSLSETQGLPLHVHAAHPRHRPRRRRQGQRQGRSRAWCRSPSRRSAKKTAQERGGTRNE